VLFRSQDNNTSKVLMLGYMDQEAFEKTTNEKVVTFFSRSKNRLWTKGETSGNFLKVMDIALDCDQDALLIKVEPVGVVCHTGADTCWNEENIKDQTDFLKILQSIIQDRQANPSNDSYTSALFKRGIDKIAQKVGEEAVEVVIEAKNSNQELFLNEAADLLFHYLILLVEKGATIQSVLSVLEERNNKKG